MFRSNTNPPSPVVLIASSSEAIQRQCRDVLTSSGMTAHMAEPAALSSSVERVSPDVIVADAAIEEIDGAVDRVATRGEAGQEIPVLFLYTEASQMGVLLDAGDVCRDLLQAPIRSQELVVRINALLARSRRQTGNQADHDMFGEHTRILSSLFDYSAAMAGKEDLNELVEETLEIAAAVSTCRRIAILLPDAQRKVLTVAGSVGLDGLVASDLAVPVGEGIAGRVFESGGQVLVDTTPTPHGGLDVHDAGLYEKPPSIAVAMRASERTVGVLYLSGRVKHRAFSDYELECISLITNCAGAAIQGLLARRARDAANEAITEALASLAEHRDDDTGQHLQRMTGFCLILADALSHASEYAGQIDRRFMEHLRRAAPLHDIGKVAVPDHILFKPGKLDPEEVVEMRRHAVVGAETIRSARRRSPDTEFLKMAEEIARSHHEWFDGNGYPDGLSGTDIPLCARIAALADVYDALTSKRVYKEAFSHAKARTILRDLSTRQFDPAVVHAFFSVEDEVQRLADKLRDGDRRSEPNNDADPVAGAATPALRVVVDNAAPAREENTPRQTQPQRV